MNIYHLPELQPEKGTINSAGYDIYSAEAVILEPGEWKLVSTMLYSSGDSAKDYIDIRPRSGLAYKFGVTVLNSPGLIDADYTGEIMILLINHSNKTVELSEHTRIAQMIIHSDNICFVATNTPKEARHKNSEQIRGGFGSTGLTKEDIK